MYETLTRLVPALRKEARGWEEFGGSSDFEAYGPALMELVDALYRFGEKHPDLGLNHYYDILAAHGIEWTVDSIAGADVSSLDGRTVLALLMGVVRADRIYSGNLVSFLEDGHIERWLLRLGEIDEG